MARRRPVEPAAVESPLPHHLRRENVVVETFVPWTEQPPPEVRRVYAEHAPNYPSWRRLRAWRRWQDAITEWGAGQGLDVAELRQRGLWPVQRPPFAGR